MIRINQIKIKPEQVFGSIESAKELLYHKAAKILRINRGDIISLEIARQSVDARKKEDIWYIYTVDVKTEREEKILKENRNPQITREVRTEYRFPAGGEKVMKERPVIIGAGPAGLFCAYLLAENGYRPILLDRGKDVDSRAEDVERFWQTGVLETSSNVQFGEGGAGTFSDGKLNTLVKDKDGRGRKVLEIFVKHGAPEKILYDSKPHIGTDILCKVVKSMRLAIEEWGGEVRFQTKLTDIVIEEGNLKQIQIQNGEILPCNLLVLAIGHSARDTFHMLYERQVPMEAKSFAVGLRVEHPQTFINQSQYGEEEPKGLPVASYKVAAKTSGGRGVYSFCMCPGGYVVNASSEEGRLAVNGMSYSKRDGRNANSAVIVSVTPKDFESEHPLAGISFQRKLEERAYALAGGKIPVQTYGDFKRKVTGEDPAPKGDGFSWEVKGCLKGDYAHAELSEILPEECNRAFVEGMEQFGKMIKGFNSPGVLLSGVESRTSSPVRIHRNERGQTVFQGIYPCGEGAGYAGGISSAAMDGILTAQRIAEEFTPFR